MSDQSEALNRRTMRFALDVCAFLKQLPYEEPGPTVRRQLAKASTGIAFNYRASCRARSHAEFTAKIGVVAEESDETQGWLEFIHAARLVERPELEGLMAEATALCAIMSKSAGTARSHARSLGRAAHRRAKPDADAD